MPITKTLAHKALVRKLLGSKKLSEAEQAAFKKMADDMSKGSGLDQHQKLWIEALNDKYLAKR